LFICTSPTPRYYIQGPHSKANDFHTQSPITFQKSTHWMSSTSCAAHISAASDEPKMYCDRSAWRYGTLCHHMYRRLGTRRLGTVILCISFVYWPSQGSLECWYATSTLPTRRLKPAKAFQCISVKLCRMLMRWLFAHTKLTTMHSPFLHIKLS
jgi:hypothetical protein